MCDICRILFAVNQADTGGRTALYLVLQAGTTAIAEEAVLALPHPEQFL
jgi:hypothetical protein